jgi:cell wall-associated NlpC family hydrolase
MMTNWLRSVVMLQYRYVPRFALRSHTDMRSDVAGQVGSTVLPSPGQSGPGSNPGGLVTSTRIRQLILRAAVATAAVTSLGLVADGTLITASASAVAFPTSTSGDPAVGHAVAALSAWEAGNPADYAATLETLAAELGPRVVIDPARLVAAWTADAQSPGMKAMLSALTQLGVSYRYASSKPGTAFDCSGLVKWAWAEAGVPLPSNSSAIIRSASNTSIDELEPGDVMFYPGHVMLALGVDDAYVHAVGRGKPLEVHSMWAKKRSRLRAIDPAG